MNMLQFLWQQISSFWNLLGQHNTPFGMSWRSFITALVVIGALIEFFYSVVGAPGGGDDDE